VRTSLVLLLTLVAWPAAAATFTVTSQLDIPDSGINGLCRAGPEMLCTLRAAVQEANATPAVADTIVLPAGVYELDTTTPGAADEDVAATGDLDVTSAITIQGAGADVTIVQAGGDGIPEDRVLHVLSAGDLVIEDVTIRFGRAIAMDTFTGGGVLNEGGGVLELRRCRVEQNRAGAGGGVFSSGELLVEDCTFADNIASGEQTNAEGGGLRQQDDLATVTGTTFSGNQAVDDGSAIHLWTDGQLILENSTLSGSLGGGAALRVQNGDAALTHVTLLDSQAAGVSAFSFDGSHQLVFENSVVAGSGTNDCVFSGLTPARNGGNLDSDGTCGFAATAAAPLLAALADNGGPTETHLPQTGSPVVDQAESAECLATDQRGELRPDLTGGPGLCDIGAVELFEPGRELLAGAALGTLALLVRGRRRR
jgi:hypothetical protein